MAKVDPAKTDEFVQALDNALKEYKKQFPGAKGEVYRQNSASIRVRIIDNRVEGMTRTRRHDSVWEFLSKRVDGDVMSEVSMLLVLPDSECRTSLLNAEFEDRTRSGL